MIDSRSFRDANVSDIPSLYRGLPLICKLAVWAAILCCAFSSYLWFVSCSYEAFAETIVKHTCTHSVAGSFYVTAFVVFSLIVVTILLAMEVALLFKGLKSLRDQTLTRDDLIIVPFVLSVSYFLPVDLSPSSIALIGMVVVGMYIGYDLTGYYSKAVPGKEKGTLFVPSTIVTLSLVIGRLFTIIFSGYVMYQMGACGMRLGQIADAMVYHNAIIRVMAGFLIGQHLVYLNRINTSDEK